MNIEEIDLTPSHGIFRFSNLANAKTFADRAIKSMAILLGDDGKYWVVTLGLEEELVKSGYEGLRGMVLPDLLKKNLLVVICGTSVSNRSAELGLYYAGVGNRFWQVLYEVGLTSIQVRPENYRDLLDFRIGLTDLVKKKFGSDENLSPLDFDVESFRQKMLDFCPKIVCLNGKRAAKIILGKRKIEYGYQEERIGRLAFLLLLLPLEMPDVGGIKDGGKSYLIPLELCRCLDFYRTFLRLSHSLPS